MINVRYSTQDLRYIFLTGDKKELIKIEKYFNKVPQYMFLPSFRGIPKPEVFIYKLRKNDTDIYYCHSGLWKNIYDFCDKENIIIDGVDTKFKYREFNLSLEDFTKLVDSWELNLKPRDYQLKAAWLILKYRQSLSQLATRAGKTLIAYIVFRYMLEYGGAKNILMIVPSILLVRQGVQDMKEYKEFFTSEEIWAGGEMCASSNLTIGTFQSLVRKLDKQSKQYNPKFFDKFDVVCVDECHTLKCKSINMILSQNFIKFNKLKFGFSGSLPDEGTIDSFCCQSLMGPKIQDIRAKELMDNGYITPIDITQYRIQYDEQELMDDYIRCGEYLCSNYVMDNGKQILLPKDEQEFTIKHKKSLPFAIKQLKDIYTKKQYRDYLIDLCKSNGSNLLVLEQMLVHRSEKRMMLLIDLLNKIHKNTIVFAHHTEYLKYIYNRLKVEFPNRNIYLITGSTNAKNRDKIKEALLEDTDGILVASYGCLSTGITLKNLDYGIMFQSFKSQIINKQSLGRGLGLADGKECFYLYDFIDCFPTKKLYIQGLSKVKLYKEENYKINIVER